MLAGRGTTWQTPGQLSPNMALLNKLLRTAALVHPGDDWSDRLSRIKYCVRGLASSRRTNEFFSVLSAPKLAQVAIRNPRILSKLQRPYLHRDLNGQQRLAALSYHYRFVDRQFLAAGIEAIYSPAGLSLAALSSLAAGAFTLRLMYRDEFEKEGDLSLVFCDESDGGMLFSLTFCVHAALAGQPEIFIGGLQGCRPVNERERIVTITRAMHGLRPKALLIFAAQQLAGFWQIPGIRAVSNAGHIYRHYRKRKRIAASYDEFWAECGGTSGGDETFVLPARPVERAAETLKSGKRQMYRRRYAMLDELAAQIRDNLTEACVARGHCRAGEHVQPPPLLSPVALGRSNLVARS